MFNGFFFTLQQKQRTTHTVDSILVVSHSFHF